MCEPGQGAGLGPRGGNRAWTPSPAPRGPRSRAPGTSGDNQLPGAEILQVTRGQPGGGCVCVCVTCPPRRVPPPQRGPGPRSAAAPPRRGPSRGETSCARPPPYPGANLPGSRRGAGGCVWGCVCVCEAADRALCNRLREQQPPPPPRQQLGAVRESRGREGGEDRGTRLSRAW